MFPALRRFVIFKEIFEMKKLEDNKEERPEADDKKNGSNKFEGFEKVPEPEELAKPEPGEHIRGLVIDKRQYTRGTGENQKTSFSYAVQEKNNPTIQIINGNANLDPQMRIVEIGDEVIIERLEDVDTGKPSPMKQYQVYIKPKE